MKNRVWKRLTAVTVTLCMAVALLGTAALAAGSGLATAARTSNLLRQGAEKAVTATADGAAVTVSDLALPTGVKTDETVTVLVQSGETIRYILGQVSGGAVSATYQENGAGSFTMMAAQGAIDQGSLTVASSADESGSGYEVTYQAALTMSDDLAILATSNKNDATKLKSFRFTCVLEDDLLAQMTDVSADDVALQGSSCFELVSADVTDAGISVVYKLIPSVVDNWITQTTTNVKAQLQQPMSISCTKTVTAAQLADAQNSAGDIYTYAALTITYEPSGRPIAIPTLGSATQIVVPAELAKMTVTAGSEPAEPAAPSIADPAETGVAILLNTDDHSAFMQGDDVGTFRPDDSIKRSEVAQIFYNLLRNQNVPTTVSFNDVPDSAWYADAVNALASLGIINGVGDGNFEPDRAITRAEFAAICARFAKAASTSEGFPDVPASHWAYAEVITAASYGWITGYEDGSFGPARNITRAEAATMVNRMLGRLVDQAAIDAGAGTRFPDVAGAHWAWYEIVEATSDHDYTMNSDRTQETWTK